MKWQKGISGNPSGLPRDRDVVSVEHWLKKAEHEMRNSKLGPNDRLKWQTQIIALLLDRKDIPAKAKPAETKPKDKANLLEDLENGRPGTPSSGTGSVGDGSAPL